MTLGQWERSDDLAKGLGRIKQNAPGRGVPSPDYEVPAYVWNNVVTAILELQAAIIGGSSTVAIRVNGGANVGSRPRLNLIEGSGIDFTVVDDPADNEVDITVDWLGLTVRKNGADVGTRRRLNLIEGANITLTVADDGAGGEVDVTITGAAGGASVGATLPVTIEPDATASAGVSAEASRVDHRHAIAAAAAGAILIGDSAAEGASTSFARADHTHSVAAPASPAQLGAGASAAGAATGPARADHEHRPRVTIGAVNVLDIDTDGQITLVGGTGGAGLPGEPVAITAGAGGTGNTAGADLTLDAGAKSGSGLAGRIYLGASTARQIIAGSSATTLVQVQSDALSLIPPGGTEGTRDVATVLSVSPASAVVPWSLILVEGDPNGQLAAATAGSLAADLTNKRLYIKAGDSPSTVWNRVDSGGATLQTAYDAGEVIAATDADGPVEINDSAYTAASDALSLLSVGGSSLATATAPAVTATAAGTARPAVYQAVPAMVDPAQGGNYGIGYRINPASLVTGSVDVMIVDGDPNGIAGPNAGSLALDRQGRLWVKSADSPSTAWTRIAGTSGAGAAAPSLQSVYEDGGDNDVPITSADGAIILRNSADATDLLQLYRTFAGAGRALYVSMGATTTGRAVEIESSAGATGDLLRVSPSGTAALVVSSLAAVALTGGAGAAATAGAPLTLTTSAGGAATAGAAGGAGGQLAIVTGIGGAASSAQSGGAGGGIVVTQGAGGAGDAGNNRAGGIGGGLTWVGGDGAAAAGTQAGRQGGVLIVSGGTGGAAGASASGGNGGSVSYFGGNGGASNTSQTAGTGGTAAVTAGPGGANTSSGAGGAGASGAVNGGAGGATSGAGTGGIGGQASVLGGAGGASSSGTGGAGGVGQTVAGNGASGATGGAGGQAILKSGAGGNGSSTGGAAGGVRIETQNAGTGGNVDASDIEVLLGTPTGTGRQGAVKFGAAVSRSAPICVPYVNKSGGTLNPGDVVVPYTSATDQACTTTTTAGVRPLGVVVIGGAAEATVWVCQFGVCKVNVRTTDNVNIARGDTLITSTTAANAWGLTGSATLRGAPLGIALGAASSNTTIWAFVCPLHADALLPRSPPLSSPTPTALYSLDNSLADSSGSGRTTLALAGGATNRYCQGPTPSKRAWRTLVTAYGDGLQLTSGNSGWAQLTGAMSAFCRVNPITDVRATVDQVNRVLMECGASDAAGGANNTAWRMMFGYSASVIVEWYSGAGPTQRRFETTELCQAVGRGFVLGFTRSSGGVVKVYRDGVLMGTSGALTLPDGVTNGRFCVGVSMSHAGYAYGGADISDAVVYTSELTQAEVDTVTRYMLGDIALKESV
ncbi:MAG: hypothetical protein IT379_39380 [Deltaproteobacteria bacterium]|nr:hypothetical protein [Deltaproteobacteria bacterium]